MQCRDAAFQFLIFSAHHIPHPIAKTDQWAQMREGKEVEKGAEMRIAKNYKSHFFVFVFNFGFYFDDSRY